MTMSSVRQNTTGAHNTSFLTSRGGSIANNQSMMMGKTGKGTNAAKPNLHRQKPEALSHDN